MRMWAFASRNWKEMIRDPLNLGFGIGFPVILLLLLSAIQANIPVSLFEIQALVPGIAVFGLSFVALFSGQLIAKDKSESFLMRLLASPLTEWEFILGYALPLLPMAAVQGGVCYLTAFLLGLAPSWNVLLAMAALVPTALLFIALGLLGGSLLNQKQVGGILGAVLTNLSAWLSGTWFDLGLVGGGFEKVARALPFCHGVDAGRAALSGDLAAMGTELIWVGVYAAALMALAVWAFRGMARRN